MIQRFFILLVIVSGCFTIISCAEKSPNDTQTFRRYPVKNVYVKYAISGDGVGTEEMYIKDYGLYELIVSDYVSGLASQQQRPKNQYTLTTGADAYMWKPDSAHGRMLRVKLLDSLYGIKENVPSYLDVMHKSFEAGMFQLEGTDMIAGLAAERWQQVMGPITVWVAKGIIVKRMVSGENGATFIQTAIMIDTAWTPDTSLFNVPSTITFEKIQPPPPGAPMPPPPMQGGQPPQPPPLPQR